MKKLTVLISMLTIIIALVCSVGNSNAGDVGVRIGTKTPQHGHSNMYDGGILRNTYTVLATASTVTIENSTSTIISWDSETHDSLSTHSTGSSRVVVPSTSYSLAVVSCSFLVSKTNSELTTDTIGIYKNGSVIDSTSYQWPSVALLGVATVLTSESYVSVESGDYIECGYENGDTVNSAFLQSNKFTVALYR